MSDDDDDAPRKRPAWLGRSASDLLSGRGGRVGSTNDVHTGGAREVEPAPEPKRARIESRIEVETGDAEETEAEASEKRARVESRLDVETGDAEETESTESTR